ncbi:hypothetical protein [uncultured Winogradskyella sp.]|uniref:hypothetical protein n=1 Tax=uncultured Winogradskyella sp. TaxID=395353 RepID=UPI0030DB045B|tara:strand:+ start:2124 stop:2345 length:222 start_codon:yes stop_codon:yes gene_type:complete
MTPFNENGPNNAGSVKIYKNISDNWTQIGNEIIGESQLDAQNWFSSTNTVRLSTDGTIVAIGASNNRGNSSSQ